MEVSLEGFGWKDVCLVGIGGDREREGVDGDGAVGETCQSKHEDYRNSCIWKILTVPLIILPHPSSSQLLSSPELSILIDVPFVVGRVFDLPTKLSKSIP